jgi:hypothetical protein
MWSMLFTIMTAISFGLSCMFFVRAIVHAKGGIASAGDLLYFLAVCGLTGFLIAITIESYREVRR